MRNEIETSSGNVFEDIGLPDADQEHLKAELLLAVHRLLRERALTQKAAAALLRTTQPQVSAILGLRPVSISVGKLMEFLTILGQDVEVRLTPSATGSTGRLEVTSKVAEVVLST